MDDFTFDGQPYDAGDAAGFFVDGVDGGAELDSTGLIEQLDYDFFDMTLDDEAAGFESGDVIAGTPDVDVAFWQPQTTGFTCAIQAQRSIIEAYTGQEISESQLVYEATAGGILTEGGMSPENVGMLLEQHGIPCHQVSDASIADLVSELSAGHKVIVGVDSGELWGEDYALEDFFSQAADHAIWVTGVRQAEDGSMWVVINDSGVPDGAGKEYPLEQFKDAWEDSCGFYVATDAPPPDMGWAVGFSPEEGGFGSLRDALESEGKTLGGVFDTPEAQSAIDSLADVAAKSGTAFLNDFLQELNASGSLDEAVSAGLNNAVEAGVDALGHEVAASNLIENLSDTGRNAILSML